MVNAVSTDFATLVTTSQVGELTPLQGTRLENLTTNPLYEHVGVVSLRHEALFSADRRGSLAVPGIKSRIHFADYTAYRDADGAFTWVSDVEADGASGSFTVTFTPGHGTDGHLELPGAVYLFSPLTSQLSVASRIRGHALAEDGCGVGASVELPEEGGVEPGTPATAPTEPRSTKTTQRSEQLCPDNRVSVLFLFTDEANAAGDPVARANTVLANLNQIASNSAIAPGTLQFERAGVERLAGFVQSSGDIDQDLGELSDNAGPIRDALNADLVVLFTDADYRVEITPGFFSTVFGAALTGSPGFPEEAHAIVEIDAAPFRYTFSHEVGHLFGGRHENDNRVLVNRAAYSFPHAWASNGLSNYAIETSIMHRMGGDAGRVMHFSNPDINFNGIPTGTADRNTTQQIRDWMDDVADYRPNDPGFDPEIDGPSVHANGESSTWVMDACSCDAPPYVRWAWSDDGFTYHQFSINTTATETNFSTSAGSVTLRLRVRCENGADIETAFRTVYIEDNIGGPGPCCSNSIPYRAPDEPAATTLSASPTHLAPADPTVTVTLDGGAEFAPEGLTIFEAATGRSVNGARVQLDGSRATVELPTGTPSGVYLVADPSRPELKSALITLLNR